MRTFFAGLIVVTGSALALGTAWFTAVGMFSADAATGFGILSLLLLFMGAVTVAHSD